MYPCTYKEKFPTGRGFEWSKNEDLVFTKKLMTTSKISLGSIQWLDYVQQTSDLLLDKNGKRQRIYSGWNSTEVKIGAYNVDGYVQVNQKKIIFEYDGCYWHECSICSTESEERDSERRRHDKKRDQYLEGLGYTVIKMQECKWMKMMKQLKTTYKPRISPLLFVDQVGLNEMVQKISNGELYGFAMVDLVPTSRAEKFLKINWPPIMEKQKIQFEDLPQWMQESTTKQKFPRETIVQTMHAKKILLHTSLINFYIKHGFEVGYVYKVFEYEGAHCFKDVFTTVYEARVDATETKDSLKANAIKLTANSMFGINLVVSLNIRLL